MASARARLASHSVHTSPSSREKASKPSSHAMMAPSRPSSSISWAWSYSCSSTATACERDEPLHQSISKSQGHDKEASPSEPRHEVKTHLAGGEARLEEVSILARWHGKWRRSRLLLPLREHLPSSSSRAIVGNGAG
jgi:hypothetical protein